jgi:hypothetical protein
MPLSDRSQYVKYRSSKFSLVQYMYYTYAVPMPAVLLVLKGSVQRKLRWVKNGVNRSVGASDCGAGHSFVVLFRFHLGFTIFPFPVSTTQIIGEFWKNR